MIGSPFWADRAAPPEPLSVSVGVARQQFIGGRCHEAILGKSSDCGSLMKLRIQGNSLRLRLTQKEVARVRNGQGLPQRGGREQVLPPFGRTWSPNRPSPRPTWDSPPA